MLRAFRFFCSGVSGRVLGIAGLAAILFMAGCTTSGNNATQLAVATLSGGLPQGSVSVGAGAYPSTALSATGGTAPYTWTVTMGTLPTGLALSSSGIISGAPTTAGTFPFTVTVTDAATPVHTATGSLSITINAQIAITNPGAMTDGEAGGAYPTKALSETGGVGTFNWVINSGSLPGGLTLSSAGSISGTISASVVPGTFNFTAKVTDSQGNVAVSGTIAIKVDAALVITAPTLPVGVVNVSYSTPAFTATGGSGSGYAFAVASGSLAPLAIGASSGVITGTPTTAGTSQFTVKVTDSLGYSVTSSNLSIVINAAIGVGLSPTSPVTLDQGKTQLVTATVSNDPNNAGVTWSAVTGLGSLSGATSTTITYNAPASVSSASSATFKATSVTDPTKSATYTINLVPPPQITTTTMAAGNVNGAYSSPVSMTGGVAPYTWAIVTAPTGLTLSSSTTSTVTVQGTPTVSGNNQTFTIKVADAQGLLATSSGLTVTVYPTLVITPPALPVGVVGVSYTSPAFTATGGSGSGYTFTVASGSLAPLAMGASSGIITGTPTTAGTLNFTAKVTDSVSNMAVTSNLSITINPAIAVGLAPASPVSLDQGKTQLVTATVSNDPSSAGVTWSAVTGLGSLSGATSTTITYNAPASVSSASSATFKATSVTDPTKSATYTINLVPPPQITTTTMAAGNVNGAYSSPVSTTGGVAPYTWAIQAAPTGLVLNGSTTSTVTVQGTPTVSGNNQAFTIKVTDAQGLSATSTGLTISIFATLVLTPPSLPLPTGVVGLNYPTSETFTASGGSGAGFSWSIVAGNPLPTGLNLSSATGTTTSITAGPPTVAGTYPFAVKLTDSVGNTATTSGLSITINPPISITLSPTQPFAMDQNTTQLITATVNNDPSNAGVTWSALTGPGSLSGQTSTTVTYNSPATVSTSSIATFTATSVTDPSKSASFSVSLEPPPVIATPSFPGGIVGSSYSSQVTANGGVGPYTWSFTALPAGLSLSSSTTNTVNVTGTPTTAGANQTVTIKVTDAKGLTNTLNSTITITAPSCSTNCTISGHVTSGPVTSGVTVALSNGPTSKPNTTTDGTGFYSFTGLTGGTYKVTPSLPGYTFSPSAPSVATSASTTTQDFTEMSALPSYSITGTVSYAGTKTGRTYIRVFATNSCNSGCGGAAGTSLASAPSSTGTSYTVRGLLPGTYNVVAEVDTLGNGVPNASNPNGSFGPVTITNADVSVPSFALTATTPAPVAPSGLTIAPGGTFALVMYDQNNSNALRDSNGREIDTSYKVYWGTDVNATNGTPATFAAHGTNDRNYIVRNLTPGTYYFKMSGFVGTTESALSPIVSAVVAAGTGPFTLSGTVSFPGTATGPLYVGLFNGSAIYGKEIMPPFTSPVSYSVPGIAAGNYQAFAIIDQNNNGLIEPSDISNVNNSQGGPPPLTVSGNTTNNITLTSAVSTINITTDHNQFNYVAINDQYSLNLGISWGTKRPVAMTLLSGPNVQVPWDFPVDTNNSEYRSLMGTAPLVGDTYQFQVTFSDGSTQTLTGSVTAVLSSFAPSMAMNSPIAGTTTVPVLNWMTPASTPSPYTYNVGLYNIGGTANVNVQWQDNGGHNGNGIASGTTSIVFNADGSANSNGTSISSLPTATNYQWFVRVQDSNGNTSEETIEYDVP